MKIYRRIYVGGNYLLNKKRYRCVDWEESADFWWHSRLDSIDELTY
jgi:hypothetical protein